MFSWRSSSSAKEPSRDSETRNSPGNSFSGDLGPGRIEQPGEAVVPGAGSNLASLFGSSAAPPASMNSLSFQRPVQPSAAPPPKPAAAPAAANAPASEGSGSTTLHAELVHLFSTAGGEWQSAGQAGLALVGGPLPSKPFQIVLYEPTSKRPFSTTTVVAASALSTPSQQYVSLTDDQQVAARSVRLIPRPHAPGPIPTLSAPHTHPAAIHSRGHR